MKTNRERYSEIMSALKDKLSSIKAEPEKVRMGYALGVFLASTPLVGLKAFIAIFITYVCKWNKAAALIGVFHVNLFTAPLFYGFAFVVGRFVLGSSAEFSWPDKVNLVTIFEIFRGNVSIMYNLTLGGLILGVPMAIGAYFLAKCLTMPVKRVLPDQNALFQFENVSGNSYSGSF
jgi:uncharacterized protein